MPYPKGTILKPVFRKWAQGEQVISVKVIKPPESPGEEYYEMESSFWLRNIHKDEVEDPTHYVVVFGAELNELKQFEECTCTELLKGHEANCGYSISRS
jgi:hypothetical protein